MKFLILVLIAIVAWLAWRHFSTVPPLPPPPPPPIAETKVERIDTEEKYGKPLRTIADKIFSPLDAKTPNSVAN